MAPTHEQSARRLHCGRTIWTNEGGYVKKKKTNVTQERPILRIKRLVLPEMKILSLITHPHVVPNP